MTVCACVCSCVCVCVCVCLSVFIFLLLSMVPLGAMLSFWQMARDVWMSVMQNQNAGIAAGDVCVWHKPNLSTTGGLRLTQTHELFLMFYFSNTGVLTPAHFNFQPSEPRPKTLTFRRVQLKVCDLRFFIL